MFSLALASIVAAWRPDLFLQYFYFGPLLALTHLFTLGFLTSLMMGVLHRLGPALLDVHASSRALSRVQFALFFIGSWGMITHFWIGEWTGMSWSTFLVWAATIVQIWNFRKIFSVEGKNVWVARYVGASMIYLALAASFGISLGLVKGYGVRIPLLSPSHLDNVFAHAHMAGVGWILTMILGFELKLVPATMGNPKWQPLRFALLQVGTMGLSLSLWAGRGSLDFALVLGVACVWHAAGPVQLLASRRFVEWELLPLVLLVVAGAMGIALTAGVPGVADPARGRLQLAYGVVAIVGFMILTVVTIAFKLFPMWVWKERFQDDFGKRPVPGMKELASETLRKGAAVAIFVAVVALAAGIYFENALVLRVATLAFLAGVVQFLVNFARVARWGLLDLEYKPTPADEEKFREMFPDAP